MSSNYLNPLLRRGPNHAPYYKIKSVTRIRSYLKDLRTQPFSEVEYYSTFPTSTPKTLYDVDTFKKLLMAWDVAKDELRAAFIHNTTCTKCSSAP